MKLLVALASLLCVGYVVAEGWVPGKEYVYLYKGRIFTGIPEMKKQFTGLGVRCKLIMQVHHSSEVIAKLVDVEIASSNEEYHTGIRSEFMMNYRPIEHSRESVMMPFVLRFRSGLVEEVVVSREEPSWVIQLKKGIISQLQLHLSHVSSESSESEESSEEMLSNTVRRVIMESGESLLTKESKPSDFFTTFEDGIGGECRTVYTVSPMPDFQRLAEERSLPEDIKEMDTENCLLITKTRDYEVCNRRPAFKKISPPVFPCDPLSSQCKMLSSRTSVTHYLIRGDREDYRIERIWNEGHVLISPYGLETEKIWSSTNQTLSLIKMEEISHRIELPKSPLPLHSLTYDFRPCHLEPSHPDYFIECESTEIEHPWSEKSMESEMFNEETPEFLKEYLVKKHMRTLNEEDIEKYNEMVKSPSMWKHLKKSYKVPHSHLFSSEVLSMVERRPEFFPYEMPSGKYSREYLLTSAPNMTTSFGMSSLPISRSTIKSKVIEYIRGIVEDLEEFEYLGEKDLPGKMVNVARLLSVLSLEDLKEVHEEVHNVHSEEWMKKSFFHDSLSMCGSNPCVMMIKELIMSKRVTGYKAASMLFTIPSSIKTPIPELLHELVDLIKSDVVEEQTNVWMTGIVSLSNLFHQACVHPVMRVTSYPVFINRGKFCSKSSPVLIKRYIPYLEHELMKTKSMIKREAIIQALGNTGHPEILKVIKPFIFGEVTRDAGIRSKAIFSLRRIVEIYPSMVWKLCVPIWHNINEHYEVRMAAFTMCIKTNPHPGFFQNAATGTWFEPNQQVGSFVYSTLSFLANSTHPLYRNISMKASMALPLCKPFDLGLQYSHNVYLTKFIEKINLGTFFHTAWFGNSNSMLPRSIYNKITTNLGGLEINPLEMTLHMQGIQRIINRLVGPTEGMPLELSKSISSLYESKYESPKEDGLNIMKLIKEKLNMVPRFDEKVRSTLSLRLMDNLETFIGFDERMISELIEEGIINMSGSRLSEGVPLKFVQTRNFIDTNIVVPSEMGLPLYFAVKMPVMTSVSGHIKLEVSPKHFGLKSHNMPTEVELVADLKPVVSMKYLTLSGIICPFTMQSMSTGVDTRMTTSLPIKVVGKFDYEESKLSVITSLPKSPKKVDLFYYHTRPFTIKKSLFELKPITEVETLKTIDILKHKPLTSEIVLGRKWLGLHMNVIHKVDQPFFTPITSFPIYELLKNSREWDILKNIRESKVNVVLDVSKCETKEMKIVMNLHKEKRVEPIFSYLPERYIEEKLYKHPCSFPEEWTDECKTFFNNPYDYFKNYTNETPLFSGKNLEGRRYYESMKYEPEIKSFTTSEETIIRHLHTEIELSGKSEPRRCRFTGVYVSTPLGLRQKWNFHFEREPIREVDSRPFKVCLSSNIKFPKLPVERKELIHSDMSTFASVDLRFGESCSESSIVMKTILDRDEKMKMHSMESVEAKMCEEEESKGLEYTPSCKKAMLQSTMLNKVILDIKVNNLGSKFLNISQHVCDLTETLLYPKMTKDITVRNPENKIVIVTKMIPKTSIIPYHVWDILMYKPRENIFFKTLKSNRIVESLVPLNAKESPIKRTMNKILGMEYTPMCKLQENVITTFDNVSYKYPLHNCYHLVAADCTPMERFAVLSKEIEHGKIVKLLLGENVIMVIPESSGSNPEMTVTINGKSIRLPVGTVEKIESISSTMLEIRRLKSMEIEIKCPIHGVKIVCYGSNFKVELSNMYRNRVCGLCGDFNLEKMAEFKGPRKCVYDSPELFAYSYAVDKECKRPLVPSHFRKSVERCVMKEIIPTENMYSEDYSVSNSESRPWESSSESLPWSSMEMRLKRTGPSYIDFSSSSSSEETNSKTYSEISESQRYSSSSSSEETNSKTMSRPSFSESNGLSSSSSSEETNSKTYSLPSISGSSSSSSSSEETNSMTKSLPSESKEIPFKRSMTWDEPEYSSWEEETSSKTYSRPSYSESSEMESCLKYRTKVIEKEDEICFSVNPVRVCSSECRPVEMIHKEVKFHCLEKNTMTRNLSKLAKERVIYELAGKPVDMESSIPEPRECMPVTVY